jgi:hypothetical protein
VDDDCDTLVDEGCTPAAPSGLRITQTAGAARFCWTDNSTNETGFQLRHEEYWTRYVNVTDLPANTICYESTYWEGAWHFCVRSVGGGGASKGWVSITLPTSHNVWWVTIPCGTSLCQNAGDTDGAPHAH